MGQKDTKPIAPATLSICANLRESADNNRAVRVEITSSGEKGPGGVRVTIPELGTSSLHSGRFGRCGDYGLLEHL